MSRDYSDTKRRRIEHDRFASSHSSTPRGRPFASTPNKVNGSKAGAERNAEADIQGDRDWYGADENGHVLGDDFYTPFGFGDATYEQQAADKALADRKLKGRNPRDTQRRRDNDDWEKNRMLQSGVAQRRTFHDDFDDDEDSVRVHLIPYKDPLRPPFLDKKEIFSRQLEPVQPVKDPTSDMATLSRRGSAIVAERQKQKERQKQAAAAVNAAGTTLGNITGAKDQDEDDSAIGVTRDENAARKRKIAPEEPTKPTQGQSDFSKSKSLREQREYLPAFAVRENLLNTIRESQTCIIVGETGSGKTTQITQFLYEEGYARGGMIACTQPRRVAAMSVAKRVSEEMECKLGGLVGYQIRFEDCTSDETKIVYMTDGVLLRQCMTDPSLSKYSCIIIDEAHERSLNTDLLLGLLKARVSASRRDLKILVTSATLNSEAFAEFFPGSPQLKIPGRTFKVDDLFAQSPATDFVMESARQVLKIHVSQGPGDILCFLPGAPEIAVACELIEEQLRQLNDPQPLLVLPLYSQLPSDMQRKIFEPAPKGVRKVVCATNLAETSITIDGIVYTVDSGFEKQKIYNPRLMMDSLQVTPISRAAARQRAGRAGRTAPGKAFKLYTARAFKEELYEDGIPEIQRSNLVAILLTVKELGVADLLTFPWLSPPPQDAITSALFELWALGALDHLGRLTPLGRLINQFPLEPPLAKVLIVSAGEDYRCSEEALTIVSMLQVPTVYYRPRERQEEADAAHERFLVPESDHCSFLNVYNMWVANGRSNIWCARHFLNAKSLMRAADTRQQLADIMQSKGLLLESCGTDWDPIRKAICAGFYHQAAKVKSMTEYTILRTSVAVQLKPESAVVHQGILPDYVVYHELMLTSKEQMVCVTQVDPHWLADLGGVFFSIKEVVQETVDGGKRLGQKKTEVTMSKKAEIEQEMQRMLLEEGEKRQIEERREEEIRASKKVGAMSNGVKKFGSKMVVPRRIAVDDGDDEQVVRRPVVRKGLKGV
ncbi:MAG: DEAH-box RNA helicase prp16 [Chrysothrix sp. TS-e1954]|nr:MAG: DEAH-box RNA helicase prp16 [Chrysothrix sp. TS-e1954]